MIYMKIRKSFKSMFLLFPLVSSVPISLAGCHDKPNDVTIEEIYDLLETPYKHDGAVLQENEYLTDSPTVFYHNGKWYMSYIRIYNQTGNDGYETYIAESSDLIHWNNRTKIFAREPESGKWDSRQIAGYMGYVKNDLFGDYTLQSVNGHHYISYLGGNLDGYETDPLSMGEAWFDDVMDPSTYHKYPDPVLSPNDTDARAGEDKTIYKSNMFIDDAMTLGHRYVNFYNGKGQDDTEGIFIAVSDNGYEWQRYWPTYVFKDTSAHNTGDPVIVKYKDTYIMLYYILTFDGKTYDNFAISKDLIHWTPWTGTPLIESSEEWDNQYAHKPSIVCKDGILYHFYCAVNTKGQRFISVATSKPLI